MGKGYTKTCIKCGYSFNCNEGIGFMFPKVYAETVRKAKAGKLGKILKTFYEEHPDGAINAENVALCCDSCGHLKSGIDLTMYIPKGKMLEQSKDERCCVAFPFPEETYVMSNDLEEYYEKYADYPHKCGKCRGKMHVVKENETLLCPHCKEPLEILDVIMWD